MKSDYVFLCGIMWCNYGQEDAGKELERMTRSSDPDIRALAGALLTKGDNRTQEGRARHTWLEEFEEQLLERDRKNRAAYSTGDRTEQILIRQESIP